MLFATLDHHIPRSALFMNESSVAHRKRPFGAALVAGNTSISTTKIRGSFCGYAGGKLAKRLAKGPRIQVERDAHRQLRYLPLLQSYMIERDAVKNLPVVGRDEEPLSRRPILLLW
jgi:hypothetical protein